MFSSILRIGLGESSYHLLSVYEFMLVGGMLEHRYGVIEPSNIYLLSNYLNPNGVNKVIFLDSDYSIMLNNNNNMLYTGIKKVENACGHKILISHVGIYEERLQSILGHLYTTSPYSKIEKGYIYKIPTKGNKNPLKLDYTKHVLIQLDNHISPGTSHGKPFTYLHKNVLFDLKPDVTISSKVLGTFDKSEYGQLKEKGILDSLRHMQNGKNLNQNIYYYKGDKPLGMAALIDIPKKFF